MISKLNSTNGLRKTYLVTHISKVRATLIPNYDPIIANKEMK